MQQYKGPLLIAGIGAISMAALIGLSAILFGTFGELQFKILASVTVVGFYCFTVVATFGNGKEYLVIGTAGSVLAAVGLMVTLPSIWVWSYDAPWKAISAVGILSFALAHGTMNYRLSTDHSTSFMVMIGANVMVMAVTSMLLLLIFGEFKNVSEGFFRTLGAFGILTVALTLVNALVAKYTRSLETTA